MKALNSPPIASISVEIVRAAGRRSVPLKNMCSAKCAMPLDSGVSYREPAASMTKHETDPTCGNGAVTTRMPFPSVVFSKIATPRDGIDTLRARTADPKGHRRNSPSGCARCRNGWAIGGFPTARASSSPAAGRRSTPPWPAVRRRRRSSSSSGTHPRRTCSSRSRTRATTALTSEAVRGFAGETWLITGAAESTLAKAVDHVVVATPAIEDSYCHTASYTCAVAAGRALQGEDVSGLAADVFRELDAEPLGASEHDRFVVAGAGRDLATSLEAVLKLREGAHVAAEAHHTEQLLHGHLAAIDPSVRCFVLEGEGRAAKRAVDAMRALGELGCDALLVPTTHPVVDIVRFQLLTCDLAEARGIDPDLIRWDEEPWDRARKAQDFTVDL